MNLLLASDVAFFTGAQEPVRQVTAVLCLKIACVVTVTTLILRRACTVRPMGVTGIGVLVCETLTTVSLKLFTIVLKA
ncbi:hypothetical protein DPMN_070335 [Dreissena polymorpha]|uniref:Uncharacterized protein n=1 Tax=Dreissena polymorpha TaxID=45954 RepID=A0A9D4BV16_DREPO|nr:hypothetical protein DPMN_070335 [Dreissena polymorpha]